jgi:hypothetical protein
LREEEVEAKKREMTATEPEKYLPKSLQLVFQAIREGKFGEREILLGLTATISNRNDWYLVGADF